MKGGDHFVGFGINIVIILKLVSSSLSVNWFYMIQRKALWTAVVNAMKYLHVAPNVGIC
jgi:hypothetical protein